MRWLDGVRWRALARVLTPVLFVVLAMAGVVVSAFDADGDGRVDRVVVTVTKPTAAPQGDLQATAPEGAKATEDPADSELRDESPPDVPAATLQVGKERTDELADQAGVEDTAQPVGGAQNYSVVQDFSGSVFSDFLAGVTPTEFCLHYTVSPNLTGWGDVRGVQGMFVRTRAASATFIGDFESHFLQMVPLSKKAWTQGAFNPYCRASIEIIATGKESRAQWLASSLFTRRTLASLMLDVMRRYSIPVRFVDPQGCTAPAGYTDHNHMECGNDHTDVSPNFPFDVLAAQLRELQVRAVTARDRGDCRAVHAYRVRRREHKPRTASGTAAFERRRARVRAHGLRCVDGRAVRR